MGTYRIAVEKGYLSFSAGHFLILGEKCERLHGHNYAVEVALEGTLTEIGYVFDFIELKRFAAEICDELDHRVLLPTKNPDLIIDIDDEVIASFRGKRFVFPKDDVLLLSIENATAELLARHICELLVERLKSTESANLTAVRVRVDESPGQSAFYRTEIS